MSGFYEETINDFFNRNKTDRTHSQKIFLVFVSVPSLLDYHLAPQVFLEHAYCGALFTDLWTAYYVRRVYLLTSSAAVLTLSSGSQVLSDVSYPCHFTKYSITTFYENYTAQWYYVEGGRPVCRQRINKWSVTLLWARVIKTVTIHQIEERHGESDFEVSTRDITLQ